MNRLPGPMTMSSASAMAWSASSVGWTSSGVTQTRSTRLVLAIRLCPVTWVPSSSSAHSVITGARSPARPGRAPRARGSSRARACSKSPCSSCTRAASSRLPTAWPPRPAGGVSGSRETGPTGAATERSGASTAGEAPGKRYWSSRPINGSASASATMQLRMSPTAGIPSWVAEHAGRAAVVGDGDHGRQVGRVLLEAAQQRREAGPAADRDDARTAGEEPLLVDDLDHRLLAVARPRTGRPGRGSAGRRRTGTASRRGRRRSGPGAGTGATGA